MTGEELFDGYDILFSPELRLAHEAVLTAAAELSEDGWPTVPMILRWAKCYDVPVAELAGLCGILAVKRGNSHYYCDSRRHPELVNRLSPARFSRRALVAYGFYNNAALLIARSRAAVH
jgi:hypothetical protein